MDLPRLRPRAHAVVRAKPAKSAASRQGEIAPEEGFVRWLRLSLLCAVSLAILAYLALILPPTGCEDFEARHAESLKRAQQALEPKPLDSREFRFLASDGTGRQSFKPVREMPRMMWRWKSRNAKMTGKVQITHAASVRPYSA